MSSPRAQLPANPPETHYTNKIPRCHPFPHEMRAFISIKLLPLGNAINYSCSANSQTELDPTVRRALTML